MGNKSRKVILEEAQPQQASSELSKAIDNEILLELMISQGWKKIKPNSHNHYLIKDWLEKYAEGKWLQLDNCYCFESVRDATIFSLRWA